MIQSVRRLLAAKIFLNRKKNEDYQPNKLLVWIHTRSHLFCQAFERFTYKLMLERFDFLCKVGRFEDAKALIDSIDQTVVTVALSIDLRMREFDHNTAINERRQD